MQNSKMTSFPMGQPLLDTCSILEKRLPGSRAGFEFQVPKHVRVRARPPLSRAVVGRWSCHLIFMHPEVSVSNQSCGCSMVSGVWYLSHAMLVIAELIVWSMRGLACILANWFWPTEMSLSLTYGSPEVSCNKRTETYFG